MEVRLELRNRLSVYSSRSLIRLHSLERLISPLLANLFLHYVFDMWMTREFPHIPFER